MWNVISFIMCQNENLCFYALKLPEYIHNNAAVNWVEPSDFN